MPKVGYVDPCHFAEGGMARLAPSDGLAKISDQSLIYTLGQSCIDT